MQGISLARYAAVKAATAEGFALPDVLAVEGLGADAWKAADAGWKLKLAQDRAVVLSFQAELAAAEDWLSRRVAPLEDNPEAWVAFLNAFTQSTEPFALLETHGLGMNDVSRLARRWARRVEQEPALEATLAKIARAPGTVPRIELEPSKLRSSPLAEAARSAAGAGESPSSAVSDRRALEAHRAVLRALAEKGAQAKPEVSPPASATVHPSSVALPPGMRGFRDMHGTQPAPEAPPAGPVLPFARSGQVPKPASEVAMPVSGGSPIPEGMRHFSSLTGTHPASEAASGPALPFLAAASRATEPPTLPHPEVPQGMRGFVDLHRTQAAPDTPPVGPVLPFKPSASPQPNVNPEGMRHFKTVSGTEIQGALDVPAGPALPFGPTKDNAPRAASAALPSPAPRMTLEQYARMCVELALYPTHKLDILRHHGVDDEERCRLDGYWRARVREDAGVRAAWDRYYAEHWTRLRAPQGKR